MSDVFLFAVLPWLAVLFAIAGTAWRLLRLSDTVTARSSQMLESRMQRFGAVPWHFAILAILLAHLVAILFPLTLARLLASPGRLYFAELLGLSLGLLATFGIALLFVRRTTLSRVTSASDWALLAALLLQAASGVYIALTLRWGSAWFVHTASPWLASLARLDPQVDRIAVLPFAVKLHFLNAFVLVALLPLSRLAHALTIPVAYLWRPPQLLSRLR